jgi:hypothetical protein
MIWMNVPLITMTVAFSLTALILKALLHVLAFKAMNGTMRTITLSVENILMNATSVNQFIDAEVLPNASTTTVGMNVNAKALVPLKRLIPSN